MFPTFQSVILRPGWLGPAGPSYVWWAVTELAALVFCTQGGLFCLWQGLADNSAAGYFWFGSQVSPRYLLTPPSPPPVRTAQEVVAALTQTVIGRLSFGCFMTVTLIKFKSVREAAPEEKAQK